MIRAAYLSMNLIGWSVIVPCSLASVLTGLIQSLGTEWGFFRHYWVAAKPALTVFATTILLVHMPTVSAVAAQAAETTFVPADLGGLRTQLVVHSAGGLLVLLVVTILSVFKPWGATRYGRERQRPRRESSPTTPSSSLGAARERMRVLGMTEECGSHDVGISAALGAATSFRRDWRRFAVIGVVHVVLIAAVVHLATGGFRHP